MLGLCTVGDVGDRVFELEDGLVSVEASFRKG